VTSKHRHGTTGKYAVAGDVDKAIADLAARVARLEVTPPPTRPWPLPATTREVIASGTSIQGAVDAVADGTLLRFPLPVYTISAAVNLRARNHLILDFGGATIVNSALPTSLATSYAGSAFWWSWTDTPPRHVTIRNAVVKGAHPTPGTLHVAESAAVLHVMGGAYIELDNVTASGILGDMLTVNENADHVWAHGNHLMDCGRNNVSVVCGSDIVVEDNCFDRAGYCGFDIEPEPDSVAGVSRVTFRRNTLGAWVNSFWSLDGADAGQPISDINVADNTCTVGLLTAMGAATRTRPQRIAMIGNTSPVRQSATFRNVDGLEFAENDAVLSASNCTVTQ